MPYVSLPNYVWFNAVSAFNEFRLTPVIKRLAKETRADVVHAHTESLGFATVQACRALDIPSVLTIHGINTSPRWLDSQSERSRMAKMLSELNRIVLVGPPLNAYVEQFPDHAPCEIVPNGFRLPPAIARNTPPDWTQLKIVSVGNLHEGKGVDLNLYALAELDKLGRRNWTYDIVGDGYQRSELQQLVSKLELGSRVTFHGHLPHDAALEVMCRGNTFLLPSYREAFGVAYLEAMAAGLLTIGVSGQGPSSFIHEGHSGYLVEGNNVKAIVSVLCRIVGEPDQTINVAKRGQAYVNQHFTWDAHARTLAALYQSVL